MPRSPRKELEITHIREDVLHAAARAVCRHGLEATTIHDIADEAGYTAQTLYAYFKGKQEILDSLVAMMGTEMLETFEDLAPPGMTFRQRLELLLRRQANFITHWGEAFIVYFAAKALSDPVLEAIRHPDKEQLVPPDPFQERLTSWIRDAAKPSEIGGLSPEDAALFLRGLTSAFFFKGILKDKDVHIADQIGMILELFFNGVNGRPAAARKKPPAPRAARARR